MKQFARFIYKDILKQNSTFRQIKREMITTKNANKEFKEMKSVLLKTKKKSNKYSFNELQLNITRARKKQSDLRICNVLVH